VSSVPANREHHGVANQVELAVPAVSFTSTQLLLLL